MRSDKKIQHRDGIRDQHHDDHSLDQNPRLKIPPLLAEGSIDAQQGQSRQEGKQEPAILLDDGAVETVGLGDLLNLLGRAASWQEGFLDADGIEAQ